MGRDGEVSEQVCGDKKPRGCFHLILVYFILVLIGSREIHN